MENFISVKKNTINDLYVNKEIDIVVYAAKPPNFNHSISLLSFNKNHGKYIIKDKYPVYNLSFDKPGNKEINIISYITKADILYNIDTILWNINVKK